MKQLGKLKLENRIFLSPMLEPNDIAFRLLCKKAGAAITYTGMVHAHSKKELFLDDKPILQLFGPTSDGMQEFIKKYDSQVSGWDFNLGCPSKLSKKLSHGAFMHTDFENIEDILKVMRSSTKKPISIKLRKSPQALDIARLAEKYVDSIGIHGRTSQEGYSGNSDYGFALKLKQTVSTPIIYSGDVNEENIEKILQDFDFVFVGRASMGNPEIFARLTNNEGIQGLEFKDYLRLAKKYNLPFRQIKFQAMQFTKGRTAAKDKRMNLIRSKTIEEIEEVMK